VDLLRNPWKVEKEEIRRYVYATDTTKTTNAQLLGKIKQLFRNYVISVTTYTLTTPLPCSHNASGLFGKLMKRDANSREKRDAIANYMQWVISQPSFKHEMDKVILDYITLAIALLLLNGKINE